LSRGLIVKNEIYLGYGISLKKFYPLTYSGQDANYEVWFL